MSRFVSNRVSRASVLLAITVTIVLLSFSASFAQDESDSAQAATADTPTRFYAIRINGKLVGYSQVGEVKDLAESNDTENRENVRGVRSQTTIKVSLLGKERRMRFDSVTRFDTETGMPKEYTGASTSGDSKVDSRVTITEDKATIQTKTQSQKTPNESVVTVPDGFLFMGSNDFFHWNLLAQRLNASDTDEAQVPLLVPESRVLIQAKGEREDAGDGRDVWKLTSLGADLIVDRATGEMLELQLPSQETVIEIADASILKELDSAPLEDLLAKHFIDSNIQFPEPMAVTKMTARIEVNAIGSGVENAIDVLSSSIQTFDGEKNEGKIVGQVTIETRDNQPSKTIPFPTPADFEDVAASYLDPEALIEADDPNIEKQAKELTAEVETRWQAVQSIASWVADEIAYEIADSPSAALCLEKRKGDCGPHSTLTVAMLRSVGISSRLIGGLVYTPSFGGSFGQHAWVEVYMGDDGWVAIDPTTGEVDRLSATHIKLFEGMGGVLPKSLEVLSYEPVNEPEAPVAWKRIESLPLDLSQSYRFTYRTGETDLGQEVFTLSKTDAGFATTSKLELAAGGREIEMTTELAIDFDGRPLAYDRQAKVGDQETSIKGTFSDESAHFEISGPQTVKKDVELPPETFCFDNNFLPSFLLMAATWPLEPESKFTVQTVHPSSLQIIPLTVRVGPEVMLDHDGKQVAGFKCQVAPLQNNFEVTADGLLLRVTQGPLVLELEAIE